EAAEESELAVDHYELLVVRPLVCVIAVEKEREPIVRGPIEAQLLHPFALQEEHGVKVPGENVDPELFVAFAEGVQILQQGYGQCGALGLWATQEASVRVELPAREQNVPFCLLSGFVKGAIVVVTVHEQAHGRNGLLTPRVSIGLEDAAHGVF